MCGKAFSDLSNLQKHKKTHKNGKHEAEHYQTGSSGVATTITGNLSTLTDGQQYFYVTADQSQLLITTVGDQGSATGANIEYDSSLIALQTESQEVDLASLDNRQEAITDSAEEEECVLAVISEEGAEENPDGNQTVEYITQDGNCIRISLPSNVDPYAHVSEYFSNFN